MLYLRKVRYDEKVGLKEISNLPYKEVALRVVPFSIYVKDCKETLHNLIKNKQMLTYCCKNKFFLYIYKNIEI